MRGWFMSALKPKASIDYVFLWIEGHSGTCSAVFKYWSLLRRELAWALRLASLELEGGESLMEHMMTLPSSCSSSCCDSCLLNAMASAANWVRSLVLHFLAHKTIYIWMIRIDILQQLNYVLHLILNYLCKKCGVGRPISGAFYIDKCRHECPNIIHLIK